MFKNIRYDIKAIKERDPAARSGFEVFMLYSGFHAVLYHRVAHWFFTHKMKFIGRWISQAARAATGVEIHPGATIGKGLMIDHGMGVVIGETAIVGDNCTIYQGVTLGGTGKDTGKRHPTIGNNVMIGSGAKVLGPFTVGDNAKIAAGAVVLDAVPEGATAVGVPARMIYTGKPKNDAPKNDLDQIHIPDPVSQELCKMYMRIEALEKQLAEKNNKDNNSTTESDNK
ncbi:MAG: serine O-acetyltransferase [Ruminococcaceae bacterium]|nr:serine O-acetyltransferase [Oscillospiraceae bacterium]